MEAVILAGGFGTRLRTVVPDLPKPMAPIGGRPFLEILLGQLASQGFERIVLSLGYQAEAIQAHFGNHFGDLAVDWVVEPEPLGTGGATRLALQSCRNDHVFVFNGDTFLDLETVSVEHQWHANHRPILVARHVDNTARYGKVLTSGIQVRGFSEKGSTGPGLINAGCYVLERHQLDGFPADVSFSLETDFLIDAVKQGIVDVFVTEGQFIDIGVPADYLLAQEQLSDRP